MFNADGHEIEDFAERMTALAELPFVDGGLAGLAGLGDEPLGAGAGAAGATDVLRASGQAETPAEEAASGMREALTAALRRMTGQGA